MKLRGHRPRLQRIVMSKFVKDLITNDLKKRLDGVEDAPGEHTRFPRPRAREDREWCPPVGDRGAL